MASTTYTPSRPLDTSLAARQFLFKPVRSLGGSEMNSVIRTILAFFACLQIYGQAQSQDAVVGPSLSISENGKVHAIPDPSDAFSLARFSVNQTVASELGLTEKQVIELKKLLSLNKGHLNGAVAFFGVDKVPTPLEIQAMLSDREKANRAVLDELLTPSQLARLSEIVFQIEIARVGIGEALTNGLLGADIGVNENQKTSLKKKAQQVEAKVSAAWARILEEAQAEMLAELSPEQRSKAKKRLGKPFYFRDDAYNPKAFLIDGAAK